MGSLSRGRCNPDTPCKHQRARADTAPWRNKHFRATGGFLSRDVCFVRAYRMGMIRLTSLLIYVWRDFSRALHASYYFEFRTCFHKMFQRIQFGTLWIRFVIPTQHNGLPNLIFEPSRSRWASCRAWLAPYFSQKPSIYCATRMTSALYIYIYIFP